MLKYEGLEVGTVIKAFDFEPFPGRRDRYITGVIQNTETRDGAAMYVIKVEEDSSFTDPAHNRIGLYMFVPMEMFMDYENRISVIKNISVEV